MLLAVFFSSSTQWKRQKGMAGDADAEALALEYQFVRKHVFSTKVSVGRFCSVH
jgi:hypothetical protein